MRKFLKRYRVFLILAALNLIVIIIWPNIGLKSLSFTKENLIDMMSVIPPIFILIGLLDVWVKRETMVRFMGKDSGIIGVLLAFFIGSAAAGPLYGAFPVAEVLLKKGSRLSNVFIMVGAWSTTKIPLLLFEASAMGVEFTMIRFVLDIFGILGIAYFTEKVLTQGEKDEIYDNSLRMDAARH